jgi:glycerol-3-phosphate acyltransferase PlsY
MALSTVFLLLASYLIGAFPTSYLIGRRRGINLRKVGDGNLGGLNTFRVLGRKPALLVSIVDIGKGALAAWLAHMLSGSDVVPYLAALAAALGHDFSIYIHFQGGQGMGSILGSLIYLHPFETLLGVGLFLLCYLLFRNWDAAWVAGMVTIIGSVWYLGYPLWEIGLVVVLIVTIGIKKWIDVPLARRLREQHP